jgi:S-DNA-T family DNA segregation ATPase FtsK/SpoIIIE
VALGVSGLVALGGVLAFHWSTQQLAWTALVGVRLLGRGMLQGVLLLWWVVRQGGGALHATILWLAASRSPRHHGPPELPAPSARADAATVRRRPPALPPPSSAAAVAAPVPLTPPPAVEDDRDEDAPSSAPSGRLAAVRAALSRPAAKPAPGRQSNGRGEDAEEVPSGRTPPLPAASRGAPQWPAPSFNLLDPVVPGRHGPVDNDYRKQIIEDTLLSFNVKATVVDAHTGPTVTQFDLQPDRGVRVQRVTALANDLALALASPGSIRIEAPVPGRPVIGLQVPNATTSVVALREIMESEVFARARAPLTVALGKDVAGNPVVADLVKMPHLLIAGATGSGKSVCLNSLIACLLFHNTPDRLRLLMIDPKMVELTPFNGVPHLLSPVVTDVEKVPNTLKWALREMKDRYTKFTEAGVRNLLRYNEAQADESRRLPYIVIIIDELADLMMVAPEEVEDHICRLAQLARATGIHLVIATQRPSVDVITGLIKANFPSRIAFAVSSQVDSRTILDVAGAEKLMGRGDMLYMAVDASKPQRVQMAFLSDREIESLVKFWTYNAPAAPSQIPLEILDAPKGDPEEALAEEKMIEEATRVVREYNRASVSLLQRRLSIGYSRAARLLDQLEERGVVGPSHDGRSRIVILAPAAVAASGSAAERDPDGGDPVADDDEPPF